MRRKLTAFLFVVTIVLLGVVVLARFESEAEKRLALREIDLPASDIERAKSMQTIRLELESLKRGDFDAARALLSTPARRNFSHSTDGFKAVLSEMVPGIGYYKSLIYGPCVTNVDGSQTAMIVSLRFSDGPSLTLQYVLVSESGTYRILSMQPIGVPYGPHMLTPYLALRQHSGRLPPH